MSEPVGVLVVGAGQAGVQVAISLREAGFSEPITIVGEEPSLPYQRPPLSKGVLRGTASPESTQLRAQAFYDERDIAVVTGDQVSEIARVSGGYVATLASGRSIGSRQTVLATGARARLLNVPGVGAAGVLTLRTRADAEAMLANLDAVRDVVVVGGGFIGLEVAATMNALGRGVTVLESAPRLLARTVSPVVANRLEEQHRGNGVEVRTGADAVTAIELDERGGANGVLLESGEVLAAQLVVVGIGAEPRTELGEMLGLTCEAGIVVDEYALASDGSTLAVGDCAVLPDPTPGHGAAGWLRLESVDNAVEHAKVAATTLMGEPRAYSSNPWFWSDQGDQKLQIVGLRRSEDVAAVRVGPDPRRLTVGHFRAGKLVAAETLNHPAEHLAVKRLLAAGIEVSVERFTDASTSLRDLAKRAGTDAVTAT